MANCSDKPTLQILAAGAIANLIVAGVFWIVFAASFAIKSDYATGIAEIVKLTSLISASLFMLFSAVMFALWIIFRRVQKLNAKRALLSEDIA